MSDVVLVVGAGGQVGQELLALGRDRLGRAVVGLTHADLDIADAAATMVAVERIAPAAVINAAAYTAVDRAETDAEAAFAINREGPRNLARACRRQGVPLLHVSTDYVFDGRAADSYREDDATGPIGVYGASKLGGEDAIRAELAEHVILRTSWVFSPYRGNFVKTMLRLGAERPHLSVVADQFGGPTAAADIAMTLLDIAGRGGPFGTYHYSGAPNCSWFDFARAIFAEAAPYLATAPEVRAIATADYPTPARRPANSRLDCGKILKDYGVSRPDWRLQLAKTIEHLYREAS